VRSIWVNIGTDVVSYEGLRQLGVGKVFFDAHGHGRAQLVRARDEGFQVGVYDNPQWWGFPDKVADPTTGRMAKRMRDITSQRLTALGVDEEQCDVCFNIEKSAMEQAGLVSQQSQNKYVKDLFYWWRRSRRNRATSWTMEGHQGGWFPEAMRSAELAATLFVPQGYDEAMRRWDSYGIVQDLIDWGVPGNRIEPFYDAPELRTPYVSDRAFFYFENRLYP
jgi:hypothetical protein